MKNLILTLITFLVSVLGFASCSDDEAPQELAYTVEFNSNGGTSVEAQTVKAGMPVVKPEDPKKEGYDFSGWYTGNDFMKAWDFEKDMVGCNMTLYAKWINSAEMVTIKFETFTESNPEPVKTEKGKAIANPLPVPERDGFTFGGWHTDKMTEAPFDESAPVDFDITLYAKWNIGDGAAAKAALETLVSEAVTILAESEENPNIYSENSIEYMEYEIDKAKKVIESAKARGTTDSELNKAYTGLQRAIRTLLPNINSKVGNSVENIVCQPALLYGNILYINADKSIEGGRRNHVSMLFDCYDDRDIPMTAQKFTYEYDKEALSKWAKDGKIYESDRNISFIFNKDNTSGIKELAFKAYPTGNEQKAINVTLRQYDKESIKAEVKKALDAFPEEINGSNAAESFFNLKPITQIANDFEYSTLSATDNEIKELIMKINEINRKIQSVMPTYHINTFSFIEDGLCLWGYTTSKTLVPYEPEGTFPYGKIYTDWRHMYKSDENGEAVYYYSYKDCFHFKADNTYTRTTFDTLTETWGEPEKGTYVFDGKYMLF